MNEEFITVLESLGKEKGIDREVLIQAVETALVSASRKQLGHYSKLSFSIDRKTWQIHAFITKEVCEKVSNPAKQIELSEAIKIDSSLNTGDQCQIEIPIESFGRVVAQTAKHVVMQKICEAERDVIYREFESRRGEIVSGVVNRFEQKNVIMEIGRAEAVLPSRERVAGEEFQIGQHIRAYIIEVNKGEMPAQIVVSRTHPGFVKKLFELEIPEISEGTIEVKALAREPGERSKIAVRALMENVDPIGACVGMRGSRIRNIVRELHDEKIDIVQWDENISSFITSALSPAKVVAVRTNDKEKSADVTVGDDQLSLAIGRKGQNVRLAARLTGWKINVRTKTQFKAEESARDMQKLPGIGMKLAWDLVQAGFNSIEGLASADTESLMAVPGVGEKTAEKLIEAAKKAAS